MKIRKALGSTVTAVIVAVLGGCATMSIQSVRHEGRVESLSYDARSATGRVLLYCTIHDRSEIFSLTMETPESEYANFGMLRKGDFVILDAVGERLQRVRHQPSQPPQGRVILEVPPRDDKIPLLAVADRGDVAQLTKLLKEGTGVDVKDPDGRTALFVSASRGHAECVKVLLDNGADINASLMNGDTPLLQAAEGTNAEVVKVLVERGAKVEGRMYDGTTPLMRASLTGSKEIVKFLLDKGADANATNNTFGWTPLWMAALRGDAEVARLLLDKGARVDASDEAGTTPLMQAAFGGYPEVVKLLLEKGANVKAKNKNGQTALWAAVQSRGRVSPSRREEIAKILFRYGATP